MTITAKDLTRAERSALLYAETTLVDYGGLMEGQRMNDEDHTALNRFQDLGMLTWGRVPGRLLGKFVARDVTHWVEFTDAGWALAHQLRRETCQRSRDASVSYKRFKAEVEQTTTITAYYTDRANGVHAAKAP